MNEKPSILEVIGQRIDLRRAGREFVGRCPFHSDSSPSLSVSDTKQVFHCFGCGESGDVIDFIRKLDRLTYRDAIATLGVTGELKQRPVLTLGRRRAAEIAAAWVNDQWRKFNVLLAEAMECRDLADEIADFELAEIVDRELILLHGFYDALKYPREAAEMMASRQSIEALTDGAAVTL